LGDAGISGEIIQAQCFESIGEYPRPRRTQDALPSRLAADDVAGIRPHRSSLTPDSDPHLPSQRWTAALHFSIRWSPSTYNGILQSLSYVYRRRTPPCMSMPSKRELCF